MGETKENSRDNDRVKGLNEDVNVDAIVRMIRFQHSYSIKILLLTKIKGSQVINHMQQAIVGF